VISTNVILFFYNRSCLVLLIGSGNQPLRANYGNFNLNHTILIQGRTHERWERWFAKLMRGGRDDLQRSFCKSLLPPLSAPLDQHHVAQIEVSIVFTERLVSTWYVALLINISVSFIFQLNYQRPDENMGWMHFKSFQKKMSETLWWFRGCFSLLASSQITIFSLSKKSQSFIRTVCSSLSIFHQLSSCQKTLNDRCINSLRNDKITTDASTQSWYTAKC
jgi:hypothetical protein